MSYIPPSTVGNTPYERVMGHAPHVLAPWAQLEQAFFEHSVLPRELLEQVRRTLALGHGCGYCQARGGPPEINQREFRASLAVRLAKIFASDHKGIDAQMIQTMREHFTDTELVELVAFMGFMWAGGTFGRVLGIQSANTAARADIDAERNAT